MVEVAWRHVHQGGPEAEYFHRLVRRGKPAGVAIVALARRLLVLAYHLVTRRDTHRELELAWFEAKLARLAATRPHGSEPEPCDRDWAADQVEALTGLTSPRRAAGIPRRLRRRPRTEGATGAGRTGGRRKHRLGSTPTGPAERGDPPERELPAPP